MTQRVTKALRWAVFVRDGGCVLHKLMEGHVCRDTWGQEHAWNDLDRCSLEHLKWQLGMSVPRIHDLQHCVTLCAFTNGKPPSKEERALMRAYLAALYPVAA